MRKRQVIRKPRDGNFGRLKMADGTVLDNVISLDRLPELRAEIDRFEAQRTCMRISDRSWQAIKRRARESHRPLTEALESELARYARWIRSQF